MLPDLIDAPEIGGEQLRNSPLEAVADAFSEATISATNQRHHGHISDWRRIIAALPNVRPSVVALDQAIVKIGRREDIDAETADRLKRLLLELHPWRKGPFNLFGVLIDSEWQSNLKWGRLQAAISPLKERLVLDVGCGNGYYMLRMLGAQAKYVLGIEPSQLFIMQYCALKKYLPEVGGAILPLRCEEIPFDALAEQGISFDTVFSMGVLSHRKNPLAHLRELARCLKLGGELVLETLMISGDGEAELVPKDTYAKMSNVWHIPSQSKLQGMLKQAGFEQITTVNVSVTGTDEQRQTPWMRFESLSDFLDTGDPAKTIEGYPAPQRGIFICRRAE